MSHTHRDREGVIPGAKGDGRRVPLPDARPVLAQCWPSPEFWISVLGDSDWWLTYNLPPAKIQPQHLKRCIVITDVSTAGIVCPLPRPVMCDRRYPMQWHARHHTPNCPYRNPAPKLRGEGSNRRMGVPV